MSTSISALIGALLGAAVGLVGNLVAGHHQGRYSKWVSGSKRRLAGSILLSMVLLSVAAVIVAPEAPPSGSVSNQLSDETVNVGTNVQSCEAGASCEQINNPPPTTTEITTTTQAPILADQLCRDPDPTDPVLPEVEICVVAWCRGSLLNPDGTERTDQGQIKLRPRIINNQSTELDITIDNPSAVRILLATEDVPGRWRPPPKTAAGGDAPVLVEWQGRSYWAVPPNVPGDARQITFEENGIIYRMYDGFATYWDAPTTLESGAILYHPIRRDGEGRGIRETDLVFNLPIEADGSISLYGLSIIDTRTNLVLGVYERNLWPDPVMPDSF